jgi:asparagine synthase (glutamine-hydrolysing)
MSGLVAVVRFDGSDASLEPAASEIGDLAVVFEGRIDARDDLARALGVAEATSDGELAARAFAAWGDDAPARIIGEFVIAVWNPRERRLTLARDRFGVRPLYFARDGESVVAMSDLAAFLSTGDLGVALDHEVIEDFLLFGCALDETKTSFARIGRVAPAHVAVFDEHGVRQRRFWSAAAEPPLSRAVAAPPYSEVIEQFREVFGRAVADRARGGRVALSLSGGVDSTAVAATLARVRPGATSAVTAGYETLIEDHDHHFATRVAAALGIPHHFLASDRYALFERWDDPHCRGLEPVDTPLRAAFIDLMRLLGERAPVIMTGQGADAVLYASHGYFIELIRRGRIDRVMREALGYALTRRRLPPLLFRSHLMRAVGLVSDEPPFPPWIRSHLRDRWREHWSWRGRKLHPVRPEAAYLIQQPLWSSAFQSYDFAWTGVRAELTVPFFDTRVVEFLFSLPPMPHFADKDIVRRAMAGSLPDDVRLRPKRPLGADPAQVLLRREVERWLPRLNHPEMEQYVDARILDESVRTAATRGATMHHEIAALSLAVWLSYR